MSYVADDLGEWGGGYKDWGRSYKKAFAETRSHFIAEVIDFSAAFGIGGCALFLEILGVAIEDLEVRGTGRLDCVGSALWKALTECRAGKEGPQ